MPKLFEARYYYKEDDSKVICVLCPNRCVIKPDSIGRCNVRKNINGTLYATNYGLATSGTPDPIEKKPLYHFQPGTHAYSFGTVGCNLFCQFCQNWHISRAKPDEKFYGIDYLSPENAALEAKISGCSSVAYTYNEPFVWYEWVLDTAKIVKNNGQKNVLVTNGYIEPEPLEELLPYIDAANVDVKGDKEFYKELCKVSHQEAVLETCKIMKKHNVHLEITNLLIPSKNDSTEQLQELIDFVIKELGSDIPLHFSRYYPNYKLNLPPTPIDSLLKAYELATKAGLHYVYLGNVREEIGRDTKCKKCGKTLITRIGYSIKLTNLTKGMHCTNCNTFADIVL
ncbi:MAG: AmmeMemoRadiSam system radical SAM enzyme [Asgard group archaeon]|nr:AmmeMemoRadiSam system radical SAM enzyme [Asgard group archaeon]